MSPDECACTFSTGLRQFGSTPTSVHAEDARLCCSPNSTAGHRAHQRRRYRKSLLCESANTLSPLGARYHIRFAGDSMRPRHATKADLRDVEASLRSCSLPVGGMHSEAVRFHVSRIEELPMRKARVILYISRGHLDNVFSCPAGGRFSQKREGGFQISLTAALTYRKASHRG